MLTKHSVLQDTVVALQALSLFAQRVYGSGLDVSVSVASGVAGGQLDFHVTRENNVILQQQELPLNDDPLNVTATGDGCVLLQVNLHCILTKILNSSSDEYSSLSYLHMTVYAFVSRVDADQAASTGSTLFAK